MTIVTVTFLLIIEQKKQGLKGGNLLSTFGLGVLVMALTSSLLSWVPLQARCHGSRFGLVVLALISSAPKL
jgi:hypothetical protein